MSGRILSTNGLPIGVWAPQPEIFSHESLEIGPSTPRLIERALGLFVHSTIMPQELCAQKFLEFLYQSGLRGSSVRPAI